MTGRIHKPGVPVEVRFDRICREPGHRAAARAGPRRHHGRHQKVQIGMIHAGKTVTVIAGDERFELVIDGQTVGAVPRTTGREVHRYKAYAIQRHQPAGGEG